MIAPRGRRALLLIVAGLLCAVGLLACTPAPATVSPMTPPNIEVEGGTGALILSEDFEPPHAGWVRFETAESAVYAEAGEMFLEDRGAGSAVYSPLVGKSQRDVTVSARLRHAQGTVDNWMGLICRQRDEQNYYLFGISADGYYLILRVAEGVPVPLVGPHASDVINIGRAENEVRIRCREDKLSLWVNDNLLASRADDVLTGSGLIALFADAAESGRTSTTTVAFDDVIFTTP